MNKKWHKKTQPSSQYKKDLKNLHKQGKNLNKLCVIIDLLEQGKPLPRKYEDHSLSGRWKGYRECHVEPDWLLIYKPLSTEVYLVRTGSHAKLLRI